MPKEIFKSNKKQTSDPEQIFSERVSIFVERFYKKINELKTPSIQIYSSGIVDILSYYNLGNIKQVNSVINDSIKEFDEFKKISLKKMEDVKKDKKLQLEQRVIGDRSQLQTLVKFNTNISQKKKDFDKASKLITSIQHFINNDSVLNKTTKEYEKIEKSKRNRNIGALAITALTGSVLPAALPGAFRAGKERIQDFKQASGKGKLLMGLQGLSLGAGALLGSSLGVMAASHLSQKVKAESDKAKAINENIKNFNKNIKKNSLRNIGEFSFEGLSTSSSTPLRRLDPTQQAMLESLKITDPDRYKAMKSHYRKQGFVAKNGGTFGVVGGSGSGIGNPISNLNVHEGETVKVMPKKDPVAEKIDKTNLLLQQLVASNELLLDAEDDKARLAGLMRKKQDKEPKKEKEGLSTKLAIAQKEGDSLLETAMKAQFLRQALAPLITSAMPLIMSAAIPVLTGTAMIAAVYSLWKSSRDTGAALEKINVKKGESVAGTHANVKEEALKAGHKEGVAQAIASREMLYGKDSQQESAWDRLKNGWSKSNYAKGGSFETTGPHNMQVGEKGKERVNVTPINKPMPVVVTEDKSKLAKEQLDLIHRKKRDENTVGKTITQSPLLDTLGSMFGGAKEAVSSGIQATGQALSTGWEASKTAFGGAATAVGKGFGAVKDSIFGASKATGVNAGTMTKFAQIESEFNPNAKAKTSSATGLYQFTEGTWNDMIAKHGKKYGLDKSANPRDPKANALMAGEFIKENQSALQRAGLPVNDGSLYLMHFLGPGATKLLKSNTNKSAASIFPSAAKSNPNVFYNKDGSEKTVGDIIGWADKKMNIDVSKIYGTAPGPVAVPNSTMVAQNTEPTSTASPRVNKKQPNEGSIKNIKNNAVQGSEGNSLKNKEVATDLNNNKRSVSDKNVNNSNVVNNNTQSTRNINISTGDNVTFAVRLARLY